MTRGIISSSPTELLPDGACRGSWWQEAEGEGRIVCELCPRACSLKPGDRGFCFVRENRGGEMVLSTYGRSTGFCIDPIEKKPLNHFYPGTSVLSFGTAGCNLGCKFCQNWDISKSREVTRLSERATPETIAEAAKQLGCRSVAFTYNDPVIWAEYAIDTARACRERGVFSVAVTAGYITTQAREAFFREMDAANVDLKAFTEEFYFKLTSAHLQPVLDNLRWLKHETDVWFEITNLVIPGENDSHDELRQMCDWILDEVGDDVPVHFTAFHPDFRMRNKPRTPAETLIAARAIALQQGIRFAYVGNVEDLANQSTYCPACGGVLIERDWYQLGVYQLRGGSCGHCGSQIPGRFDIAPGRWGARRQPVSIGRYAPPPGRPSPQAAATSPAVREDTNMTAARSAGSAADRSVPPSPQLTPQQEAAIHRAACEVVTDGVCGRRGAWSCPDLAGAADERVMGAFVTLKRQGRLRACCGTLGQPMSIVHALQQAAIRTATDDNRFPTISPVELPYLHLDVTLLYGFQPITARGRDRIAEVEVGRHGLHIQRGAAAGLLLPVVATENSWDAEEFLRYVCLKAGLPTTAWMDDQARLQKFEGRMVAGDFDAEVLDQRSVPRAGTLSIAELGQLADSCRNNLLALLRGATPNYYLPGCPDGTFELVALSVAANAGAPARLFTQFSLRPGVPLQATLFSLCQAAAGALERDPRRLERPSDLAVSVTVMTDPAMHGTVAAPDLRGIETSHRALLVVEQDKHAWTLDSGRGVDELLAATVRAAQVRSPESAAVYSLAANSTGAPLASASVPRASAGTQWRQPGVAGTFYPADPLELEQMVEKLLANGPVSPQPWPAILVPHAGLVYSGRLAAATFRRVAIPDTVILVCPKHTRFGVDWAVAPHDAWSLPGCTVPADPALARRLVDFIPGLQLDAAAHQREHAIEVELPILARLAPHAKVVGIAVGSASLDACLAFGAGLAAAIRGLEKPPLLVISSDMNHFASDDENRRLDALALQALETLDPREVYDTVVRRHAISMCGVRPAVIVLEALRQLGQLARCERVGYATSGDVSGDRSRVVGYAGMLFGP